MDPASILVVLLAAWAIAQRTPGIVGQAAAEWQAGHNGGTTQAAEDARDRLVDAGVNPSAHGGALRQFLGNLWRGYWHGKDQDRQRQRAEGQAEKDLSWWRRRVEAAIDEQAAKYRGNGDTPSEPDDPAGEPGITNPSEDPEKPSAGTPKAEQQPYTATGGGNPGSVPPNPGHDSGPVRVPSTLGEEVRPEPPAEVSPALPASASSDPSDEPGVQPPALPSNPGVPQHVPAGANSTTGHGGGVAVLERTTPTIEGTDPMSTAVATNGTAITGMQSGSYEMLSINRHLESAVQQFVSQLSMIQNRLNRAGESTLGTVQLAGGSSVMSRMAQSAEAVAALRAAAATCAGEVSPLLLQTKSEFDRRIN